MTIEEFSEKLQECRAAVFDLDKTLVRGRVAQGIGVGYLMDELKRGHLMHASWDITNFVPTLMTTKEQGEAEGLKYFFDDVAITGCADSQRGYEHAKRYVERKQLPGAREFIKYLKKELKIPVVVSTLGCDLAAEAALECFDLDRPVISNLVKIGRETGVEWKDNSNDLIITGCYIHMKNGEEKLEHTERAMREIHKAGVPDSVVVGNDRYDHPMMEIAKLSIASPLADEETKQLAAFCPESYEQLMKELKAYSYV